MHNPTLELWVEGVGAWSPERPDWPALRDFLRGNDAPAAEPPAKPDARVLSARERRRVPQAVRMALDAAGQAMEMSARQAAQVPSLFVSAHGDCHTLDYTCATLADAPAELSPTRFHNSVHNAAAGYWTMATGCHATSGALTALDYSFASGLLEAASRTLATPTPMLLVATDVPGPGPLTDVIATRKPFGCALVLAPKRSATSIARLTLKLADQSEPEPAAPRCRTLSEASLSARGMPLLDCLARQDAGGVRLALNKTLDLVVTAEPFDGA